SRFSCVVGWDVGSVYPRSMQRVLAVVAVAACHGGGIPSSDYLDRLAEAHCDYDTRCGLFPDVATCRAYFQQRPDPSLQAAIDAGRSTYDGDKAEQCVNEIANADCDLTSKEGRELPSVCTEVLTGTGDMGAACASSSECSSKACAVPSCQMACCIGTCI